MPKCWHSHGQRDATKNVSRARHEIAQLFVSENFNDAIQLATGDRARLLMRIRETANALMKAEFSVAVPPDLSV